MGALERETPEILTGRARCPIGGSFPSRESETRMPVGFQNGSLGALRTGGFPHDAHGHGARRSSGPEGVPAHPFPQGGGAFVVPGTATAAAGGDLPGSSQGGNGASIPSRQASKLPRRVRVFVAGLSHDHLPQPCRADATEWPQGGFSPPGATGISRQESRVFPLCSAGSRCSSCWTLRRCCIPRTAFGRRPTSSGRRLS